MYFSRKSGPIRLNGIKGLTLESIGRSLVDDYECCLVVSDLSLGAWQSHQVASEFCAQLGIDAPSHQLDDGRFNNSNQQFPAFADVIGDFVDAEGRGDSATYTAIEFASRIAAFRCNRPRTFAVLLPRFGLQWEQEDTLFVRFLAQALDGSDDQITVVWCDFDEPSIPDDWVVSWDESDVNAVVGQPSVLGLLPGVIGPDVAPMLSSAGLNDLAKMLVLKPGHKLVAPECRRDPRSVSKFDYDMLAVLSRASHWLHAYAQFYGNNYYVDSWFLWRQAYRHVQAGGYGIGLRLIERAISCATNPVQRGVLQAFAQGVRIASERFAQAVEAPDPTPAMPSSLQCFLAEAKGWALAMVDKPAQAEAYFEDADALFTLREKNNREYLYFLNIWALNRLKLGDPDGSLRNEKEIVVRHAKLSRHDWRLEYVNAINIARLYKYQGDYETAENYYRRAFDTTLGVRTEGDCVYMNVCLARLNEARGSWAEAFECWMRAALHWVSSDVPEALRRRVVTAIFGKKGSPPRNRLDGICNAMEASLVESARAAGFGHIAAIIDGQRQDAVSPIFIRASWLSGATGPAQVQSAMLGSGWSVLISRLRAVEQITSLPHRRLRSILRELIQLAYPALSSETDITLVIDDCFGTEMPTTATKLLETVLRCGCHNFGVDGKLLQIEQSERSKLEETLEVEVGSAVDWIDVEQSTASVTFKRYLPKRLLYMEERQIMAAVRDRSASLKDLRSLVSSSDPPIAILAQLRSMERCRLIYLKLPNKRGISPGFQVSNLASA